jgi:hypothetical protein
MKNFKFKVGDIISRITPKGDYGVVLQSGPAFYKICWTNTTNSVNFPERQTLELHYESTNK